jgi:hypothetical protein
VILATAISFTALFVALTRPSILGDATPRRSVRTARLRFGVGVVVYTLALALSWLSPIAALAAHGSMATYYLREQASRPPDQAGDAS